MSNIIFLDSPSAMTAWAVVVQEWNGSSWDDITSTLRRIHTFGIAGEGHGTSITFSKTFSAGDKIRAVAYRIGSGGNDGTFVGNQCRATVEQP